MGDELDDDFGVLDVGLEIGAIPFQAGTDVAKVDEVAVSGR